jgi:hypothetical protein
VYQTASFTFRSLIQRLNSDLAFGSVLPINHETQQTNIQGGIMCEEAPADKLFYGNAVDQNVFPLASLKMFISMIDLNAKSLFNSCHRHENQKNSGLIDGETLDLVIQNVWLD